MHFLKIGLGFLALVLGWIFLYRRQLIYAVNAWAREYVFSDRLVLFSGRRMAILLLILGSISLFSGLNEVVDVQTVQPNVAAKMLEEAQRDLRDHHHRQAIIRCRELLKADPQNAAAWEILASAAWASGQRNQAREALASLLRLEPDNPIQNGPIGQYMRESGMYGNEQR